MADKLGGLTLSLPDGETLLLMWPDGTQTRMRSHGLIDTGASNPLWLSMPDKDNPPFLKALWLHLDREEEPFPAVYLTLIESARKRVNIRAARDRVTVLRGDGVRSSSIHI